MFTPSLRLLIAVAALSVGLIEIARGHWIGWPLIAAAGVLAWQHLRRGPVWQAFAAYNQGNLDLVSTHLGRVGDASRLDPENRAYFEFLKGVLALRDGAIDVGRAHLEAAAKGPLRTDNMRCAVQCHLAAAALGSDDIDAARAHVAAARALPHSPRVEQTLAMIESKLDAEANGSDRAEAS